MRPEKHYRALEKMYLSAPINAIYEPKIKDSHEMAEISMEVKKKFFHENIGAILIKMRN